jgi:hypothetical protein
MSLRLRQTVPPPPWRQSRHRQLRLQPRRSAPNWTTDAGAYAVAPPLPFAPQLLQPLRPACASVSIPVPSTAAAADAASALAEGRRGACCD